MTGRDFAGEIRALLEAELTSRRCWDEAPALQFMFQAHGQIRLTASVVDDVTWTYDRPPLVLRDLVPGGRWLAAGLNPAERETLCGVMFRWEAWMVKYTPDVPDAYRRQAQQDARQHLIYTRPDRIESRLATAATTAGLFEAFQQRGAEPRHVQKPTGDVPDTLAELWRPLERRIRKA